VPGSRVTVTQTVAGRQRSFTTTTDGEGRYGVDALAGLATVEFSGQSHRTTNAPATVPAGGTVTVDREVDAVRAYEVDLVLRTRYLGDTASSSSRSTGASPSTSACVSRRPRAGAPAPDRRPDPGVRAAGRGRRVLRRRR
jgi:hypothetical protein